MPVIQNLVVDEFGTHVGKYSQRVKVTQKGKVVAETTLLHLESVTIASRGVSLSADVVEACSERGIPIYFISGRGQAYASLYSAGLTGTAATRRSQLQAYLDGRGLHLALAFSGAKLCNQANLLRYMAKYRKDTDAGLYEELRLSAGEVLDQTFELEQVRSYPEVVSGEATVAELRSELMGIEGLGGKRYWRAVRLLLPVEYGFPGRKGRGAQDAVNSALNYGYGILYSVCERCLTLAGLDPYAGFLHADRPGKPSLVLDFIEEFRQPVVDRTVFAMANRGTQFTQLEDGLLEKTFRRALAEQINKRLDAPTMLDGKRFALRHILQMQARKVAAYLRLEVDGYQPFVMGW